MQKNVVAGPAFWHVVLWAGVRHIYFGHFIRKSVVSIGDA
jgi:hypothetical protein